MRTIDLLHRWTGGLIGVVLCLLGLSGAILVHRFSWVMLPHANDAQNQSTEVLATVTARLMQNKLTRPSSIVFATRDFGLDRLAFKGTAGAYADQSGTIVATWASQWERPELWLFDFHHHLLVGEVGETIVGVLGLCGIGFIVTGALLWWRTRKAFELRLWPKRLSRPAILWWHRDLGVVLAPLLLFSFVTGTLMAFRPASAIFFGPGGPAAVAAARKMAPPPHLPAEKALPSLDWGAMIRQARARFPDAEVRRLQISYKEGGVVLLRMRRPEEWLPDGRALVWFDRADGRIIGTQDSRVQSAPVQADNMLFALHTAGVGGLAYRLLMTLSGVALTMLGGFTTWTFWFKRKPSRA